MIKISLERMAKILGVKTPEDYYETLIDNSGELYSIVYREALAEDCSEEEAEQKAMDAEQQERDEIFNKYVDSLVNVFEREAENLKLDVSPLKTRPGFYAITPQENWTESALMTKSIVYGIGGWHFNSYKEFLSSGPYTPRKAVDQHLGYIGDQWKLYGYASPQQRVFSGMN